MSQPPYRPQYQPILRPRDWATSRGETTFSVEPEMMTQPTDQQRRDQDVLRPQDGATLGGQTTVSNKPTVRLQVMSQPSFQDPQYQPILRPRDWATSRGETTFSVEPEIMSRPTNQQRRDQDVLRPQDGATLGGQTTVADKPTVRLQRQHKPTFSPGRGAMFGDKIVLSPEELSDQSNIVAAVMDTTQSQTTFEETDIPANKMRLHFHVIAHPDFGYDPKDSTIYVVFEDTRLGKYKPENELQFVRTFDDRSCLMKGEVDIQIDIMRAGPIDYEYVLVKPEMRIAQPEALIDQKKRTLELPASDISPGVCEHVLDGIMMTDISKVCCNNYEEIVKGVKNMMPSAEWLGTPRRNVAMGDLQTASEAIKEIRNLKHHMPTWPLCSSETNLDSCFMEGLTEHIKQVFHRMEDEHTNSDCSFRVVSAMYIMLLAHEYERTLEQRQYQQIMRALQIQPVRKEKIHLDYIDALRFHFPKGNMHGRVKNFICKYLRQNEGDCSWEWLRCVPLLHFLEGESPFQVPDVIYDDSHQSSEWWGVKWMGDIVSQLRKHPTIQPPTTEMIEELTPLFAIDWLLPRTILACLSYWHINEVLRWECMPPEAVLAMILHNIEKRIVPKDQNFLRNLIHCTSEKSYSFHEELGGQLHANKMAPLTLKICMDILKPDTVKLLHPKSVIKVVETAVKIIHIEKDALRKLGLPRNFNMEVLSSTIKWLNESSLDPASELEALSMLLYIQHRDSEVREEWNKQCLEQLSALLAKQGHQELYKIPAGVFPILSDIFMSAWPKKEDGRPDLDMDRTLPIILTNSTIMCILRSFANSTERTGGLRDDCKRCLKSAVDSLTSIVQDLASGHIKICVLDCISKNQKAFYEATKAVCANMPSKAGLFKCIEQREKEKQVASDFQKLVEDLRTLIECIGLDLTEDLPVFENDSVLKDCVLCETYDYGTNVFAKDFLGISPFRCTRDDISFLTKLLHHAESQLYQRILKGSCTGNTARRQLTIQMILQQVGPSVEKWWVDFCCKLKDGSITVHDIDTHFSHLSVAEVDKELSTIFTEKDLGSMEQRLKQIVNCRKLRSPAASVVCQARDSLKLEGSFKGLEKICNSELLTLRCLMDEVFPAIESLESWTSEHTSCIRTFLDCQKLVDWLQSNVKELKELHTLVDLAFISVQGQGDLEVTKVTCLHAAVSGFAPLIYDIQSTSGLDDFLKKCRDVFEAFEAEKKLPQMLIDLNDQLDWLMDLKDAQGDVKENALKQVRAINDKGIYIVGQKTGEPFKTFKDIIQVKVPSEHKNEEGNELSMVYSGNDLLELQSRLILVAGKGNEEVDSFVERLDGVTGLAKTYVDLCAAGNIFFKTWTATFFCDPQIRANTIVDFFLSDHKLTGHKDTDVTTHINEVRHFMEGCLDDWRQYVEKSRTEFPELNHYTTDQLVILCKELAAEPQNMKDEAFVLLQDVHPRCTVKELEEAIEKMVAACKIRDVSNSDADEEVKDMYREYEPRIVQKALKLCRGDYSQLPFICHDLELDNAATTESEPMPSVQLPKTVSVMMNEFMEQVSRRKSNLHEKLNMLWEKFISSSSTSLTDCLSIDHVGMILKHLALKIENEKINRQLPTYLEKGKPNLIVCQEREILRVLLSVYMENDAKPLPSHNEVLLCDEHTTAEDVELLIRRAISDKAGRIFVLVSVHLLKYDVACHAEQAIEEYTRGKDGYSLAVICSIEQQDRCQLVTAFDNYRVRSHGRRALNDIRKYIATHLEGKEGASVVDGSCVRLVCSDRPGTGKSLWVHRVGEKLAELYKNCTTISLPLYGITATAEHLLDSLLPCTTPRGNQYIPSIYHIDIPYEMQHGVDHVLFNLVVLGSLVDQSGRMWRRDPRDLYIIEALPLLCWDQSPSEIETGSQPNIHLILQLLPTVMCHSPRKSWQILSRNDGEQPGRCDQTSGSPRDKLIDEKVFQSEDFQRVYQYLKRLDEGEHFKNVKQKTPTATKLDCLWILLRYCGVPDPTWAELGHFVRFLNVQLKACEESIFCQIADTRVESKYRLSLPGFFNFVVRFMIQMSKDFSTRSLNISEEIQSNTSRATSGTIEHEDAVEVDQELLQFQLKRLWEESPHPYIFFNQDQISMTFLGFVVQPPSYDVIDPETHMIIEKSVMRKDLYDDLLINRVNLGERFDDLSREEQIGKLRMVMGSEPPDPVCKHTQANTHQGVKPSSRGKFRFRLRRWKKVKPGAEQVEPAQRAEEVCQCVKENPLGYDPDAEYVLTTDNAKKILAIQMRFRCNIPVVIMGETGCGKTYLIKFMCGLQCPPGAQVKNMMLIKVHGGTTAADLNRKVSEAQQLSKKNRKMYPGMFTVLFLDEVNTTEALGLVKEVLCDNSLNGRDLGEDCGLRLIAACNPYRRQSERMIEKQEKSGLGYHVKATETADKLGRIPMRQLVYRVQPLPQSLLPLVWDFGQLQIDAEKGVILQIVRSKMPKELEKTNESSVEAISKVMVAAQTFMRLQKDECSFVSLRDVVRTMDVLTWFYKQRGTLFPLMDEFRRTHGIRTNTKAQGFSCLELPTNADLGRSLILALGVCYHAGLHDKRQQFRQHISKYFEGFYYLADGPSTIEQEISVCQDVFLKEIKLQPNIAPNQALKENVFMMVVCIELRLPLFLVGKPGSSKSLAKTIVADAMQGPNSSSELFKKLKQVYMASYQCSPLSRTDGIISTFRQCHQLQGKKGDLDKFVAVVVLDEIGLAEDSPQMPLKALHPLLEDGCEGDGEAEKYMKVGFIGISNWALDPAKMNRGILVQRGSFDISELEKTAREICSTDKDIAKHIEPLMQPLAVAYLELYDQAIADKQEFFGLRDFYSLVKMVYEFAKQTQSMPSWHQLKHAVLRNFGGFDRVPPVKVFRKHLKNILPKFSTGPGNSKKALIRESVGQTGIDGQSRYLLAMTQNQAALQILQSMNLLHNAKVIYGSSFPDDQDYVVVCRNINQIKVCMETGQTVVLLNMENLYESLYDVLNQYYTFFGGQRHVDLGLGSHRVKARVHQDFKLIVVAEKDVVYERFPIPLINRLEKHLVTMSIMLTRSQRRIVKSLSDWTDKLTSSVNLRPADIFVGYHEDTCASIVMQVCMQMGQVHGKLTPAKEVLQRSKEILLQCATPEAILRIQKIQPKAWQKTKQESSDNQNSEFEEDELDPESGEDGLELSEDEAWSELAKDDSHDEPSIFDTYFKKQYSGSLIEYLTAQVGSTTESTFIQVTTHSRLLANMHREEIARGMAPYQLSSWSLKAVNKKQQFSDSLREYFTKPSDNDQVLLIQCDSGDRNAELIACARSCILEEYKNANQITDMPDQKHRTKRCVVIIVQLPRIAGGCFAGFQGDIWKSVHLDELRADPYHLPPIETLMTQSVSNILGASYDSNLAPDASSQSLTNQEGHNEHHMESRNMKDVFNKLLHSCIHGSTAMLKDKFDGGNGPARIRKLLHLFSDTQQEHQTAVENMNAFEFVSVLRKRTHLLLQDKERCTTTEEMARAWLTDQAASFESVNKAGTFRQSIWQYLEKKITPIFAGIIAFIDTNNNLRLIGEPVVATKKEEKEKKEKEKMWKEKMWLEALNNPALTYICYEDLSHNNIDLKQIMIGMRGAGGTEMNGQLPFSWLLKRWIDSVIEQRNKVQVPSATGEIDVAMYVGNVLKQNGWWPILEAAFTEAGHDVVWTCYLEDFVKMVYKPQATGGSTAKEYELVERAISSVAKQHSEMDLGPEHMLPMIHVAEAAIRSRLQLFSEVTAQNPELIELMYTFPETSPQHPLATSAEMVLDVLSVHFLVERIHLTPQFLKHSGSTRHEWQLKVEAASPMVNTILERANSPNDQSIGGYSRKCQPVLKDIRDDWVRITAVKLFAEVVYPKGSDDEASFAKYAPTLFKTLKNTDLKDSDTFKSVEKFLKAVIKYASRNYQCRMCEEVMTTVVAMPCGHELCEECTKNLQKADDFSCHECKQPYDRDKRLTKLHQPREVLDKMMEFKQQCNSFFMEIVSRMSFAGDTPPQPGVVNILMGYVTKQPVGGVSTLARTKKMSLFNDDLDPRPVVRSVLLQLLLRSSIEKVHKHLVEYFQHAQTVVPHRRDVIDLALIYIYCIEDHYFDASSATPTQEGRVEMAIRLLWESLTDRTGDKVSQLESIAKARYGLSVAAECMVKEDTIADRKLRDDLLRAAREVCVQSELQGPRLFLFRQIAQRFSFDDLEQASRKIDWIDPMAHRNESPDLFVIWDADYIKVRDMLAQATTSADLVKVAVNALKGQGSGSCVQTRNVLLAIFRFVTSMIVDRKDCNQLSLAFVKDVKSSLAVAAIPKEDATLVRAMLLNDLPQNCPHLKVTPDVSHTNLSLIKLVVHFMTVMHTTKGNDLLGPIAAIAADPGSISKCLLPTMPDDNRAEIRQALVAARDSSRYQNPCVYECPNGHPYIIGECGMAVVTEKCPTCKQTIGGKDHRLDARNKRANLADQTKVGHCLGPASNCTLVPAPERTMSPVCTALIRLLIHLAMYVGANIQVKEVQALITPAIRPEAVPDFLWQHMLHDLEVLSRAVGKGKDHTLLLVHLLVYDIAVRPTTSQGKQVRIQTREQREKWETSFSRQFVMPLLNDLEKRLKQANEEITDDQDAADVRHQIYETRAWQAAHARTNTTTVDLKTEPSMWCFRTRVTVDHLIQVLNREMFSEGQGGRQPVQQHRVLRLFLEKNSLLQVVQLIPNILELVKMLCEHFHRRIGRKEADDLQFSVFTQKVRNEFVRKRYEDLLKDFITAWKRAHISLQTHVFSGQVLPHEYCHQEITMDTPISTFLPSHRGRGLCTVALLDYLTTTHNNFMAEYCQISGKQQRGEVSFADLTAAHLITYDPDRDLLSLLKANCTYSLEVGQGTKIEYNFKQLEQQLEERFIKGKGAVAFKLEPIVFREDLNNAALFRSLDKKIPQEQFSTAIQKQIQLDAQIMVEVSDCLANLDIAIGFLVSVGGNQETSLHSFMTNTLQMGSEALTPRASQHCKLSHTKALWLLLSQEQEKMALRNSQEPYTSVDSREYRVPLRYEQQQRLERGLKRMKVDHFLRELHECILLHITIQGDPYEEHSRELGLAEVLYVYIENKDGDEIPALTNGTFPADIKVKQCVDTWRVACQYLQRNM